MGKKNKETAESLLNFFSQLDAGGSEAEKCELHYGCSCVIGKGLEASKMLVAIQKLVGAPSAPAPEVKPEATPAPAEGKISLAEELSEAQSEIDRLLIQNSDLGRENKGLKEKLAILQKQVERLYNKNEMAMTLKRLEGKKLSEAEMAGEESSKREAESSLAPPAGEEQPAEKFTNKEFQQELEIEAAARAPREEKNEEKSDAKPAEAASSATTDKPPATD